MMGALEKWRAAWVESDLPHSVSSWMDSLQLSASSLLEHIVPFSDPAAYRR